MGEARLSSDSSSLPLGASMYTQGSGSRSDSMAASMGGYSGLTGNEKVG